ncbi:ABC transporter substrate-binding protein [Paenibacillus sp. FSL W8-1187]|uniref:ABC transporter substrate-binding protein n=1 Tax=unclassified Paenibacillus TaxID=185978 RepID=UPI001E4D3200|nr:ABC transporter substrate-binding protein [Paenibacillus sp. B01]
MEQKQMQWNAAVQGAAVEKRNRRRSRTAAALATVLSAAVLLTGCGGNEEKKAVAAGKDGEPETLELRYQGSVGSVTFPELAEDLGYLAPVKLKWIGNTTSGPQDIQTAATGQSDFGGAFNGAIIKLISAGAPIRSVISYYGMDELTYNGYFVLEDSPIRSARDLIGKKVGMNTLGAHAEFVLKEYLKRGGLSDDEIKQVTLVALPPVNTEQSLRAGQIDVAVLGGILRDHALERGGVRKLFSDFELFGAQSAGTIVFTKKFIADNPNTVRKFVEGTSKAIEWARTQPRETVIQRAQDIVAKRGREESGDNLKFWKSTSVAGKGGTIRPEEFEIWRKWLEASGDKKAAGVKLEDLYTNEFNPYAEEDEKDTGK